jgi:hypothetical protein
MEVRPQVIVMGNVPQLSAQFVFWPKASKEPALCDRNTLEVLEIKFEIDVREDRRVTQTPSRNTRRR